MNILIVDDDTFVVQKVAEGIDWDSIGIRRVFTANNMRQAYKIFETFPVDILVTDIEMPQGSGLELLEWVKEKRYPVEALVLSGYAHFAYAQKAMQYGGRKYMLKPISNRELASAISEIVQEKNRKNVVSEQKRALMQVCRNLMKLPLERINLVEELVNKRHFYQGNEKFCVIMLRILSKEKRGESEQKLLNFVVRNVIQEFFENKGLELEWSFQEKDGEWLLVFRENGRLSSVKEYTAQMQHCLRDVVQLESCVYIGRVCELGEVTDSYAHLAKIRSEAIPDELGVFCEEEWLQWEPSFDLPDFDRLERMIIKDGMIRAVRDDLKNYVRKNGERRNATVTLYKQLLSSTTSMVGRILDQKNIPFSQLYDEKELENMHQRAGSTTKWMLEYIDYLFEKLEGMQSITNSKKEYLVECLKRYIGEHLSEELSRSSLAATVYLSEDYVSRLFAAETGMSIPAYVTGQRMESAKQYLAETTCTVSEIAMKVGYSNFSYFSKTFKDYTGKTPNEYRSYIKNLSK
ncbi:MAG: helix-turn-helix domain-containing protein [Lachnospiraceae bacterium]|nr:helix-turn-helix domain-containing protein [Lachnospiraceae bacterium]